MNGNQLSITPAGITHSSGKGIAFERDAEGRIERMDPDTVVALPSDDPALDIAQLLRDCVQRLLALLGPMPRMTLRHSSR